MIEIGVGSTDDRAGFAEPRRRRVLVADRDRQLLAELRHTLGRYGIDVATTQGPLELLVEAAATLPEAVILDTGLPGLELDVTVRLLQYRLGIAVHLASADDESAPAERALGTASRLARPYRLGQILSAVAADPDPEHVRSAEPTAPKLTLGDLALDPIGYHVTRRGHLMTLPLREFEILSCLMAHPNQVVSRDRIAREIWGSAQMPDPNTVSVHMTRLRRRLAEPPASCCRIDTVRGLGYRLLCING
ncbi:response regulator transcription factor [Yinghuangia sp. ASG 101]|uniref:response regulator transcription factor n=1 Tax=Yinghuangia sp. ASG 101 TaxID=2896848 RepID=UPI001E571A96|nr:response regulator transcription factor [Yinghuangia sp. ASG 101]UGQ10479.1 response regulator transcription factor [Yinghuangia sp. ASG 101]